MLMWLARTTQGWPVVVVAPLYVAVLVVVMPAIVALSIAGGVVLGVQDAIRELSTLRADARRWRREAQEEARGR